MNSSLGARNRFKMNFRQPNEDLFDNSRMSFGEHLGELRTVFIRALYGVVIGCAVGFWFADRVVLILSQPLVDAVNEYEKDQSLEDLEEEWGYVPPEYSAWIERDQLIPKKVLVDPLQFFKMLQGFNPDFASQVSLDPYSFLASHFDQEKLPQLCSQLSTQAGVDQSRARKLTAIWQSLPSVDQSNVTRISGLTDPTDADLLVVVGVFNRLSRLETLRSLEAFQDDLTEDEASFWSLFSPVVPKPLARIKNQLDQEFDATLNRRLNRALLTGLFPHAMPPLKIDLVTIEIWEESGFEPQSLGVTETFSAWLKAGLFTGLVLSGPWIFYQLWSFVATGLYPHEQKYIHIFLPISIFLFIIGVLLAFFFVFQPVLGFLFSFNRTMGIAPNMRINEWLSFVMFLPLGFGLAFQLPLVMLFMNRIDLFSVNDYLSKWRIAVMVIFVLAMFLTPADPISMLLLAIPLTMLCFLGIAMCRWMPKGKNPFGEESASTA